MMRDGRPCRPAHPQHGQNFARAFNIQYAAESGELELCHTVSWGMTTRMIGGVMMITHGDDKGLVLPPLLAPYQVVIVPIGRGEQAEEVCRPPGNWPGGCARLASARTWTTGRNYPRLQVQRLGDARRTHPAGARAARPGGGHGTDGYQARQPEAPVSLDSAPARLDISS